MRGEYRVSVFLSFTLTLLRKVFELLTAEFLFDPQGQGELFGKDDDHMAQIIELLGDFPMEVKLGGKYSRDLFDHTGLFLFCFLYFVDELSLTCIRCIAVHPITEALAAETRDDGEVFVQ